MDLWENDTPIRKIAGLDLDVPSWINDDVTPYDVASICQGGCASGAYMPAVTYHQALKTMGEYGGDVLQFIEDHLGEIPSPPKDTSWSGLACFYLSCAVELWAAGAESELEGFEAEEDETP